MAITQAVIILFSLNSVKLNTYLPIGSKALLSLALLNLPPNFRLGGEGGDDNSILGVIRGVKRTIKEIISNIVQLIFGTVGTAISGVTDLLGLDAIFGDSRDGNGIKRHGIQVSKINYLLLLLLLHIIIA